MDVLSAAAALAISLIAAMGTLSHMQAWALRPEQRSRRVHRMQVVQLLRISLRDTPTVMWVRGDDRNERQMLSLHRRADRCGWAWLLVATMGAALWSTAALAIALARVGPRAFFPACVVFGLVGVLFAESLRRHRDADWWAFLIMGLLALVGGSALTVVFWHTPGLPI